MDISLFPMVTENETRLPVYVTTVGHWEHQEPMRRPEGFPDFQWFYAAGGEGILTAGDREFTVKAGQSFCLYPGVSHAYRATSEPWELYWLSIGGEQTMALLQWSGVFSSGVHSVSDPLKMQQMLEEIIAAAQSSDTRSGTECSKLAYSFLLDIGVAVSASSAATEPLHRRIQPVIRHIREHIHRPLPLQELAACISLSEQQLCTLFRKTMNMRPMAYVNRERINRSKELMFHSPKRRVSDIAGDVGFSSSSYFIAHFKRQEGITPEQFMRLHGLRD
ncbi:AraC family transcriptional regulator [Paenibacillus albidus]|uniref:AraC family transcriptional regulator n=1 Tax=Paenibacillus albidus TaxID=2041023 RepID=UPI001BE5E15B|nr:AraC family transcriptional regulator [Paenibacillus albidus]MBT2288364.1 AraC family transcriptional regulator [Paenibacillus albidus]